MHPLLRPLAITATLAVAGTLLHSPVGLMAPPAYAKKDKGPGFAPEAFINTQPVASALLTRFLINPQGEIDALLLADGTLVKFPPHMSQDLVAAVKPGDPISVRGFREPGGAVKAFVIINEASKIQVIERPPTPDLVALPKHLRFAALARLQVTGAIERVLHGPQGEVNGALLADGTVVRFPPHAAFDFAAVLQPGQMLAAEGLGTENAYGKGLEVTAMGTTLAALRPIYGR